MRRFLIFITVLSVMALGNTRILLAGEVESGKQCGLGQWTREAKEQPPLRAMKEKHGLGQWTQEGREQEQSGYTKEKHGLSLWTWTDKAKGPRES